MKRIFALAAITWILFLWGCGKTAPLGIDLSAASVLSSYDDHGGFHGDGMTWICYDCAETDIADQIRETENWKPFPLDDTVQALIYGTEDGWTTIGPYVTDTDGKPLLPPVEEGFYILLDRQSEELKEEPDLLRRSSFNFTLGIYDSVREVLYYLKFDT